MNDFVEQCRREWRRLGVSDAMADEMATDLAADLEEARAEGHSLRDYLGASADDPRGFAASWAAERGVVPAAGRRRRPRLLVAFSTVSVLVLVMTAVMLATGQPRLELVALRHGVQGVAARQVQHSVNAAAPVEWVLLAVALVGVLFAVRLWTDWRRSGAVPLASRR